MRLKRELSKTAFARLVGVPASTITRIEAGVVDPTYSMLQKIASGAGFNLSETLSDVGSDEPYASAVNRIRSASAIEGRRLVPRLVQTATIAPVTTRPGVRIFALEQPLGDFVRQLDERGENPVVSSLEAVAGDLTSPRSFTPIIYVERPENLDDLPPMSPTARSSVIVLPTTNNVRSFTRWISDTAFLEPEWGMLDALASPGRQADVARSLLPLLAERVASTQPATATVTSAVAS